MEFVVYGAGAVGGLVGAQLTEGGHQVTLVARGRQFEALRADGLLIEAPDGSKRYDLPAVEDVAHAGITEDAVVLLCVKSQDTAVALEALALNVSAATPVVCMQNGVANERMALRRFSNVYGVVVNCPASFLDSGVVAAHSALPRGRLDIGRYPAGRDRTCEKIAAAFAHSGFLADARADIMRWKYRKLILILANAVEAICGRPARDGRITDLARAEGERVLAAAGIDVASAEEERLRQEGQQPSQPVGEQDRDRGSTWQNLARGGSTWQSLTRGTGSAEADYLNGEIVLLGRLHEVPTPVNQLLQHLVRRMAVEITPPGSVPESEFLAMLEESRA